MARNISSCHYICNLSFFMPPPKGGKALCFCSVWVSVRPTVHLSVCWSVRLPGTSCESNISWTPLQIFMKRLPLIQSQRRKNWLGTQGRGVKGQGHKRMTLKILWAPYLLNPFTDFHETFTIDSVPKEDDLISTECVTQSRSYVGDLEFLVCAKSPEHFDGFSWNFQWLVPINHKLMRYSNS